MGTDSSLPADGVLVFMIDPTQEQSLSGSELALMEDANPGTVEASGQYYLTDQGAMYYELLDALTTMIVKLFIFPWQYISTIRVEERFILGPI